MKPLSKKQLIKEFQSYEFHVFLLSEENDRLHVESLKYHLNRLSNMRWSCRYMKRQFASLLNSYQRIYNRLYNCTFFVDYLEMI